jgi:hypothetical protein
MKRSISLSFLVVCCISAVFPQIRGVSIQGQTVDPQIVLEKDQVCNVYSLAYSPEGNYIAAGYNTNEIRIWNAKTGSLFKTLSGHTGIVWSVAFSPDGKTLVSGSADKTIKCWDVESGKELRTLKGHDNTVSFVVYSTDGEYIASGSADKTIKFWDAANGRLLQTLTGHTKTIASIAYSHDGKFMASGSWDRTIKIYYAVGGAEIMTLTGHTDSVFAVAFSPDGKYLASGSADRTIKIWDAATGKVQKEISGYADAVWSIAYSPDGKCIAGSSADGTVKLWDVESGKELHDLKGHVNPVRSVNYSADGRYLSSGDSGGIIKTWNTTTGELLATTLKSRSGEWVTWTPEGFLTGSDWALKNLSYTANGKEYSISQIYDKVYRPDLVAKKISGEDISKIAKTNSFAAIVRSGTMPDVSFTINRDKETDRDVRLDIRITNAGGGIGRVLLKLNERSFLIADSMESKPAQTVSLEYPVTLRPGENTVAVSAYDSAGAQESANSVQKISWQGKTERPRLFILAAAINTYLDPNLGKLKNCVADADGIIDAFTKYSGDIYSDVFVQRIIDSEVTGDNLSKTFKAIGEKVKPDDVFILYLAGHGKTAEDGDYYYIPYDFHYTSEKSIAENGVSKWQLIKDLSNVQADHMMILLDTCNAGSFLTDAKERKSVEGTDKDAIIERFASKAGYDMLAACSTYQDALDNYKGHGIFTYHIIEALEGYADLTGDGRITSTELSYYVITQVPIISEKQWGYRQEPQRVLPNLDFVVVGKENPRTPISLKKELEVPPATEAVAPPPVPSEAAGKSVKATIAFDDFGIGLTPIGDGLEAKQLAPTADGKASYSISFTSPLKLGFSSPYADSIDAPAEMEIADGETKSVDIPTGTITLAWIPDGTSVTIGKETTFQLENTSASTFAFKSKPLPVGTYTVTVAGKYPFTGDVAISALGETEPPGYRDSVLASMTSERSDLQKSVSGKKTKTAWGIVSLSTGLIGAAGAVTAYVLGSQAGTAYSNAVDTASTQTYRSQVELYGTLIPAAAAVAVLGLGLSPFLLSGGPNPQELQHSIDSLDEQIKKLGD